MSEFPGDWAIRVRLVGAKVSGLDSRCQVAAERWHDFSDSIDRLFDPFGDRRTRPFGFGRRAPVPTAESDGGGEVAGNRAYLVVSLGLPLRIVASLCLVQVLPQLVESTFIFYFRLCVQHWDTRMRLAPSFMQDDCGNRSRCIYRTGEQVPDMELASWIIKQESQTMEAACGFKQRGATVISNDPVIVLM